MGIIRIKDLTGEEHEIEAVEGWRVMEIIREHGLDIEGLCGGACACATCHVTVDPSWIDRLHPAREEEEAMLDGLPQVERTSRLSCQLIFSKELNGLSLSLAPAA
ncbi:MAG TPA: 2Fe-2S iron-sulfur cluster-binding protein [Aestuariivirgaceae bacterium]|jgi:2Fe-2S ferredoxin